MERILLSLIGFPATVLYGDAAVFDRWRWLARHILKGEGRTLDVGCGSGAFTIYAALQGQQATGISFDARNNAVAVDRARRLGVGERTVFIDGDIRNLGEIAPRIGQFDQVICFETIEHILNDKKLIDDIRAVLRPGGKVLLTAPYKYYRHLPGDGISEVEDGGHVRWGYTHEELREIFEANGFDIRAEEYISGWVSQMLVRVYRILPPLIGARLAWGMVFPLRVLQIIDRPLTRAMQYPFLSVGVVAVKK